MDVIEFEQRRFQFFFVHAIELLSQLIWIIIPAILFNLGSDSNSDFGVGLIIILTIAVFVIQVVYHHLSKTPMTRIKIDSVGLEINAQDRIQKLEWEHFSHYKIGRFFPYNVVLSQLIGAKVRFNYFAFSASQRRVIFERIEEMFQRKLKQ
ncbi:hypothetical protein [Thalassotalea crassostreae]|uniref:hypothetical protein n=1 Tax=Thalassotalea crassostreae TaxID=1763536 RepID=UPI000839198E|nr:hypothetical protein [Thalassotalea crassostreae]